MGSGLAALVTRGQRRPLLIDPAYGTDQPASADNQGPAIPQAYEPADDEIVFVPAPIRAPLAGHDAGGEVPDAGEQPAEIASQAARNQTGTREEQDAFSSEDESDDPEPAAGFLFAI